MSEAKKDKDIDQIFWEALQIGDLRQREDFIRQACGGDQDRRLLVEKLIRAQPKAEAFLEKPFELDATAETSPVEKPGTQIGPYKLLQKLGEGGMGEVYLAEQTEPVERRVAVKIIKAGMDTRQVIARFEAERQALAIMDHPNIAKVFDAGTTETGRPYFVMELVKGVPVTQYCDEHRLDLRQRLELFRDVCHAVQHAHQKGIIHRDLKPSNVLVAEYDDVAVPKVIDFGVAKATQQRLTDKTMFTEVGSVVGTIEYMSPEQAKLNQLDIDTRSDVYSLGVLLYELLTGETPFDRKKLRSAALDEMLRIIREEEPSRPSIKLSTSESLPSIAANRHVEPKKLGTLLRGELDWIVLKAMEKDRARRYDTANALADDIAHYLSDEAVVACPPSAGYRFRKLARRNKAAVVTSASVAAALLLGIMGTTWQAVRATSQRDRAVNAERLATAQRDRAIAAEKEATAEAERADREAERAQTEAAISRTINAFLNDDLLAQSDPSIQPDRDVKLRTLVDRAAEKIESRLTDQPLVEAAIRDTLGRSYHSLGEYEKARLQRRQAFEIRKRELGPEHADTLDSMFSLSLSISPRPKTYGSASPRDAQAAEKLLRDLLEIQRRVLGPEHPETLRSMQQLAELIGFQGRHAENEKMIRELLAIRQRVSGPKHRNTLICMRILAYSFLAQKCYAEAEKLCRETVEISQQALGRGDRTTLTLMNDLGLMLARQTKIDEAERIFRETLEESRRELGPQDPSTLLFMGNLASALGDQNRNGDAERLRRELYEIQKRVLGPTHQSTLSNQKNWAALVSKQGRFADAEELYRQVLDVERRTLSLEHPITLRSTSSLADVIRKQRRFSEAATLIREAFEAIQRVHGQEHPSDRKARSILASEFTNEAWRLATTADLGVRDSQQAVDWAREATQLLPDSADNWSNLGVALYRNGQFLEAVEALQKANGMIDDPAYRMFYAMALWELGHEDEARVSYAQGSAWIESQGANSEEQSRFRAEAEASMGLSAKDREKLITDYFAGKLSSKPTARDWIDRASRQRNRDLRRESVTSLTAALKLDPKSSEAYNDRAWDYIMLGEYEKAVADCDEAIRLDPHSSRAFADRAWAYIELGEFERAIADCDIAISVDPKCFWAFQRRAWAHRLRGEFEQAVRDANKAIEIDPEIPNAYDELAWALIVSQQWEEAGQCFEQLVKLQPKNIGHLRQLAYCEYMSRGVDASRQRCRTAIERFITPEASAPVKREVVEMCCSVMNAVDDTEAMVQLAREVIAANPPNELWSRGVLAQALLCNGQSGEAIPLLLVHEADAANKNRGHTMFLLAKAYHASGKPDVAIEWLNKADTWTSQYLAQGDYELAVLPLILQVAQKDAHEFLGISLRRTNQTTGAEVTKAEASTE